MKISANLLKLGNDWIIAQIEAVTTEDTLPGDPDAWLIQPYAVDYEGNLTPWPPHTEEREVNVRSSDVLVYTNPSTKLLAAYLCKIDPPKPE
jgi:hypothetical protein